MSIERTPLNSSESLSFDIYDQESYFDSVTNSIDKLKDGQFLTVTTMGFDSFDPKVARVIKSISAAASRGVEVSVGLDAFSALDASSIGSLGRLPAVGHEHGSEDLRAIDGTGRYGSNSATYVNMNYPTMLFVPVYTGRSHIKSVTTGDKIFIGGMSLDATRRLDAMTSLVHPEAAWWLTKFNRMNNIKPSVKAALAGNDQELVLAEDTRILIDAGVRGQSVIFDQALDVIDGAEKELAYSSEQFPTGKVGRHLLDAYRRGVDVKIGVNHPSSHDRYQLVHKYILELARAKYPPSFFDYELPETSPTLHTKIVASESRAMVGSHNLNSIGVHLGTAEMDVASSNPDFVKKAKALVARQIGASRNS